MIESGISPCAYDALFSSEVVAYCRLCLCAEIDHFCYADCQEEPSAVGAAPSRPVTMSAHHSKRARTSEPPIPEANIRRAW